MTKNFLGYEIEGEIYTGRNRVTQRSREEFEPLLQAVLSHSALLGLQWEQATPYYNDGEPCVFRVNDFNFLIEGAQEQEYTESDWQESEAEKGRHWIDNYSPEFDRLVGDPDRTYDGKSYQTPDGGWTRDWEYTYGPETRANPELFDAIVTLETAVSSEAFNHVLLDLFGDHAEIHINNVTKRIIVTECYHD